MSVVVLLLAATVVQARTCPPPVTLPGDTPVALVTTVPLSSQTAVKGQMVALRTASDVVVEGKTVIPAGTPATGQVLEARATGGLGVDGRLSVRPLYLRLGTVIVRLGGASPRQDGGVNAGQVAGLVALTPVFSGRRLEIPAGTPIPATVRKAVPLSAAPPGSPPGC